MSLLIVWLLGFLTGAGTIFYLHDKIHGWLYEDKPT